MTIHLWKNARIATMNQLSSNAYGLIDNGIIITHDHVIEWVGDSADIPAHLIKACNQVHDLEGRLITPGLIDCHTHLVYGGHRSHEFEMRLNGATYEDIALSGGGIISTVNATRQLSFEALRSQSVPRLKALMNEGVTTIEIKSGYGLRLDDERKTLLVARQLAREYNIDVRTTFLGAHAVAPEFAGRSDDYIEEVIRMLPLLHSEGLVDAVDAFCEGIGFSYAQTEKLFLFAKTLGLPIKLHAEQLSDSRGAQLAAQMGALSCDHLEWLTEQGAAAMSISGSVAVLLPAAFYFLRETKYPPIDLLNRYNVPIAISTDCNPGSSPCTSLLLVMNMACTLFKLTPAQALAGVTVHAAKALGLRDRGQIAPGLLADFVAWDVEHPAQLSYGLGQNPRRFTVRHGEIA
jgi:imidazolonepropionase